MTSRKGKQKSTIFSQGQSKSQFFQLPKDINLQISNPFSPSQQNLTPKKKLKKRKDDTHLTPQNLTLQKQDTFPNRHFMYATCEKELLQQPHLILDPSYPIPLPRVLPLLQIFTPFFFFIYLPPIMLTHSSPKTPLKNPPPNATVFFISRIFS